MSLAPSTSTPFLPPSFSTLATSLARAFFSSSAASGLPPFFFSPPSFFSALSPPFSAFFALLGSSLRLSCEDLAQLGEWIFRHLSHELLDSLIESLLDLILIQVLLHRV